MSRRNYFIQQTGLAILASFLWTLILCVNAGQAQTTNGQKLQDDTVYQTESFSIQTPADLTVKTLGGFIKIRYK